MKQTSKRQSRRMSAFAPVAFAGFLAACNTTSGPSEPLQIQEDVRNTGQTAPVELQLACASAAPSRLGLSTEDVLPTQSAEIQPEVYRVELTGGGATAECIIDRSGEIQSISRL